MDMPILENRQPETAEDVLAPIRAFMEEYKGENFLNDLSTFLGEFLGVRYVLIARLCEHDKSRVRSLALCANGAIAENLEYTLHGTPCENVVGRKTCYFPRAVRALFPDDKELQDLEIESYLGTPLFDARKNPVGLIVLMHTDRLPDARLAENALREVTPRVEAELSEG